MTRSHKRINKKKKSSSLVQDTLPLTNRAPTTCHHGSNAEFILHNSTFKKTFNRYFIVFSNEGEEGCWKNAIQHFISTFDKFHDITVEAVWNIISLFLQIVLAKCSLISDGNRMKHVNHSKINYNLDYICSTRTVPNVAGIFMEWKLWKGLSFVLHVKQTTPGWWKRREKQST